MEPPIPQVSAPPRIFTQKHLILLIVLIVISLLGIISSTLLFMNLKSAGAKLKDVEDSLESLRSEKNELEKELIFYKNTDLAKELEIVNLKLTESQAARQEAESSLNTLKDNLAEISSYANILSLMVETSSSLPPECYSEADKQKIDKELQSFGDTAWKELWDEFISGTGSANCSFSPDLLFKAENYGLTKIVENTK